MASREGQGTTFSFTLPAESVDGEPATPEAPAHTEEKERRDDVESGATDKAAPAKTSIPPATDNQPPPSAHSLATILVVDDGSANIDILHEILHPEYRVLFAHSGSGNGPSAPPTPFPCCCLIWTFSNITTTTTGTPRVMIACAWWRPP